MTTQDASHHGCRIRALLAALAAGGRGAVDPSQRAAFDEIGRLTSELERALHGTSARPHGECPPEFRGSTEPIDDVELTGDSGRTAKPSRPSFADCPLDCPHAHFELDSSKRRFSILVADDDEEILDILSDLMGSRYNVEVVRDGADALTVLKTIAFDLAIIDLQLPTLDGFRIVEALRQNSATATSPAVLFLSAQTSSQAKVRGLTLGAVDYVTKPFDPNELLARIERTLCAVEREAGLRAEALTDPLTGLSNYRSLLRSMERELERARRYGEPVALLTLDLDNLKRINDDHGHPAGNDAIELVARVLEGAVRRFETVARQGGDEFAVLLPNTDATEAGRLAERLRNRIASLQCRGVPLSISVGVAAQEPGQALTARALMEQSDEALYRAKRGGRNRVYVLEMRAPSPDHGGEHATTS